MAMIPAPPAPWYGWAVYHPCGGILLWTIARTRAGAIGHMMRSKMAGERSWRQLYRAGFRTRDYWIKPSRRPPDG